MKRLNRFALLMLTLAFGAETLAVLPRTAAAQTVPPAPAQSPPAALPPSASASGSQSAAEPFVLGADDVIEVTVRNHSELDHILTILPDGNLTFPSLGELQAAGKTPRALALEIQKGLEETLNNVGVTIVVKEVHSRRVRLVGAVRMSGGMDMKMGWKLFDAVTAAGGLTAKSDMVTGRLIRGAGAATQIIPLRVAEAMSAPTGPANVPLEPNDLVLLDELPVVHRQAQVIGQVGKPSLYDIDADTTLLSLLAQAGNPTDKAALTRVYVLRNGAQIPVNLYPFLVEGKADEGVTKFKVQANDVVFVPTQEKRFAVQGAVSKPAYYPYPEKGEVTVLEALNVAGGPAAGDISKAGVIRQVDGKYAVLPINMDAMLKKGDLSKNMALQPGDMLYIPARSTSQGFSWQNLLTPLSLLSVLGLHL